MTIHEVLLRDPTTTTTPGNVSIRTRLFFEVHRSKVCGKVCGRKTDKFTCGKGFKVAIVPSRSALQICWSALGPAGGLHLYLPSSCGRRTCYTMDTMSSHCPNRMVS